MHPQGINRTELLRNISHAFRSPLGSMLNIIDMLLLGIEGEIDQDAEQAVSQVRQDVQRLQRVVETLFELVQIDPVTPHVSDFDIVTVINQAIDPQWHDDRPLIKEIVIHTEENLPPVHASPDAVRQVTISLVELMTTLTHGTTVGVWLKHTSGELIISVGDGDLRLESVDLLAPAELLNVEMADELSIPLLLSLRLIQLQGGTLWGSRSPSGDLLLNFSLPTAAN